MWFSKTRNVKGPGGRTKILYKNIDDAFPLYIKGWKADLTAGFKVLDKASGNIKAEHATAIHGLLYSLDSLNQDLAMIFRSAYILYQSDPFEHSGFFEREIAKILDEQRRLRILKVKIGGLIELAKVNGGSDEFVKVFANIVDSIDSSMVPLVAAQRIVEARQIVEKMEKPNES